MYRVILIVAVVVGGLAIVAAVVLGAIWIGGRPTHPTTTTTSTIPSPTQREAAWCNRNPGKVALVAEAMGLEGAPQLDAVEREELTLTVSQDEFTRWAATHPLLFDQACLAAYGSFTG